MKPNGSETWAYMEKDKRREKQRQTEAYTNEGGWRVSRRKKREGWSWYLDSGLATASTRLGALDALVGMCGQVEQWGTLYGIYDESSSPNF